jgi:hypothetical protein
MAMLCSCAKSNQLAPTPSTGTLFITPSFMQTQNHIITAVPTETKTTEPTAAISNSSTPAIEKTATPFPDGYVLFHKDFESDIDGWLLGGNQSAWQIQVDEDGNHYLCATDETQNVSAYLGETDWENYQIEFTIKDIEFDIFSDESSIRVRNSGNSFYNFLLDITIFKSNSLERSTEESLLWFGKKADTEEYEPITDRKIKKLVINQWYTVSIRVDEGNITFYWDDELVLAYHDEEYLPEGAIRFRVNNGTCLDNIKVTNIGKPQ